MTGSEREEVLRVLGEAVRRLVAGMDPSLIPEVGTNIAYAIPRARTPGDVAAVEGRIVRVRGRPHAVGPVAFGASDHVARIVLTAMRFDPDVRCAANVRYSERIVEVCEEMLLSVCSFDRAAEPPGVQTMDWGVASCCRDGVPDVIYDRGAVGKEPMVRILGEDPDVVVNNILKLSARMNKD
ncbi:MAG: thiamine-phosphate synthase family protein [Methanolinea sp.]|nr:thiamine-phosphate synthase family protein [Methanolinea sp.]